MAAPNGQGTICCIEALVPWVAFLFPNEPEQTQQSIETKGASEICYSQSDCDDSEKCEFGCSDTQFLLNDGSCLEGVCIAPKVTTTTTTLPCRPDDYSCTRSSECCNFGIGASCELLLGSQGFCFNAFAN